MKAIIIILTFLTALNAFATAHSLQLFEHDLKCDGFRDKATGAYAVGGSYSMKCIISAIESSESLRSCDLFSEAVVPNAVPTRTRLNIKSQTKDSAQLVDDDKSMYFSVNKDNLKITVTSVSEYGTEEMICSPTELSK